jgi:hypothetical protein
MSVPEAITKHKIVVGSVICTILLLLGGFLYMQQEGEVEGLGQVAKAETPKQEDVQTVREGEECGAERIACGPGLTCADPVDGKRVCVSISPDGHPFIAAILPEGMELEAGAYRADVGKPIQVTVRAVNVNGGALYLIPAGSHEAEANSDQKVAELTPRSVANEYEGMFALGNGMEGSLYAVMQGTNGQEVRLSVNVAAR